jgi:chromate transport protein ChrA
MTAAAVGAIAAQHPEMSDQIATFAAAANLIATTVGTYLTLFISLPLAVRAYQWLEPILGRKRKQWPWRSQGRCSHAEEEVVHGPVLGLGMRLASWVLVGAMVLIGNRIGHGVPVLDALPGVLLIIVAVLVGDLIYVGTRRMLPAVCWISFIAMAMTFPTRLMPPKWLH